MNKNEGCPKCKVQDDNLRYRYLNRDEFI